MHVAIITAGGAGMFCGSCMHDNTWARALRARGADVTLIPTYTPIRVDEANESTRRVFLGGINVYLEHRWRFWRKLPRALTRWLDAPAVLNLTRFASSNARELGPLTVDLLRGEEGSQDEQIVELVDFIAGQLRPDVVCFSNALLVGVLRRLRERFAGRVFCTLQGDDIFLKDLPEPYQSRAIDVLSRRAAEFDGLLTHSRYYRDFMSDYLRLPADKFHIVPLGIDLAGHDGRPEPRDNDAFTVGYFARICPEKGLHQLVDAFRILHRRHPRTRLRAGGYLGRRDAAYFKGVRTFARDLGGAFESIGSPPDHAGKVEFLKSLDVLSVPTVYEEPKGLYVLEALANGTPVAQPAHGAFPELIEITGGGLLHAPGSADALAASLEELMLNPRRRNEFAVEGHRNVHERLNPHVLADATLAVFSGRTAAVAVSSELGNREQPASP